MYLYLPIADGWLTLAELRQTGLDELSRLYAVRAALDEARRKARDS